MSRPGGWPGSTNDPDDSILIQRSLGGDREAFGILVRRYERLLFRIVGGFFRNPEDVEDVVQEAFLRAFEGLSGFRLSAPLTPWLVRIATRASYDRLRKRQRAREVAWEDLPPAQQRAAQDLMAGAELGDQTAVRDLAERALASLPPKDRQVLILADAQGYSGPELAQALGCSSLAARIRLHRARRAMRKIVEGLLFGMKDAQREEQDGTVSGDRETDR